MVAVIDGADADSGTSWEMGYASALGKPIIALRTDFRRSGRYEKVNIMLEESSTVVTSTEKLLEAIKSPVSLKSDPENSFNKLICNFFGPHQSPQETIL